jgi:DNA-binding transcriptional LysR family regulator
MALSAHVPDLAALEVLLSVARTGSLGRAAQEAGVTQQAVSARIRAMEGQTGVTLVQRTARGSSLTAEGAVIARWAARVLDVAGELDAEIAALRKDLRSRVLGHNRLVVVVPPGHPWARRRGPVSAAELAATPLVSREDGSGTSQTLTAALTATVGADAEQAPPALSVSTTAAARAAVLAGAAPAAITEHAVADDLAAGRLTRIEVPGLNLDRALRAIWNGSASPPAGPAGDLVTHILSLRRKPVPPPRSG